MRREGENGVLTLCPTLKSVTVFMDRAQLTYVASVTLDVGTHLLSIKSENGWESMLHNTLQVHPGGASQHHVILRGVRLQSNVKKEDVRQRVRELERELGSIEEKLKEIDDEEVVNGAIESALKQVEGKLAIMGERGLGTNKQAVDVLSITNFLSQPAAWTDLIRFISTRKRQIAASRLELSERKEKVKITKKEINHKLEKIRHGREHQRTEESVEMTVTVEEKRVELELFVSFVAMGASWAPLYDIRADPRKSTMDITYHAQVRQNTSMDWTKVQMKLSTAMPHCSPHPPQLECWNIGLETADAVTPNTIITAAVNDDENEYFDDPGEDTSEFEDDSDDSDELQLPQVEQATVSSISSNSTFEIVGLVSIKSDNKPVRVTIAHHTFPMHLVYHAVPKMDPRTYLLAKAKNESTYMFLPGKANIFDESTFISTSRLNMIPSGAEFTISLGADDSLSVTRKKVKQLKATMQNIFYNRQIRTDYVYEFTVKGTLKTKLTLVVYDQCPISSNNDIIVTVSEPSKKMLSEGVTADGILCSMDNVGVVSWNLLLPSGTFSRVFRFAFQTKFPRTMNVDGLEEGRLLDF